MDYDEFLTTLAHSKIADLSATTVALCLSTLTHAQKRWYWKQNNLPVDDTTWDEIDAMVALANGELMSSLVGLIMPHIMATASAFKFLPCDGSIHNKDDYPLLYDAIDSAYIVSGTQFLVPDLRDRVVVGAGASYAVDDFGGVDEVTLSIAEMPSHDHSYNQYTFGIDIESVGVPDPTGVGQPALPQTTSATGGGGAHENRMPYRALEYVIIAG